MGDVIRFGEEYQTLFDSREYVAKYRRNLGE